VIDAPDNAARCCGVLVLEDDPDLASEIAEGLGAEGFTVLVAGAAASAGTLLAAGQAVDVILADPRLPGHAGIEALRRLRGEAPGRAPEIVLMTVQASQAEIGLALESGIAAVLRKPFAWDELLRAIVAAMAARTCGIGDGDALPR
jgi:DNA-binding response OmpR family regulator